MFDGLLNVWLNNKQQKRNYTQLKGHMSNDLVIMLMVHSAKGSQPIKFEPRLVVRIITIKTGPVLLTKIDYKRAYACPPM